eukprot:4917544-Prymnesium_polylepis.1
MRSVGAHLLPQAALRGDGLMAVEGLQLQALLRRRERRVARRRLRLEQILLGLQAATGQGVEGGGVEDAWASGIESGAARARSR